MILKAYKTFVISSQKRISMLSVFFTDHGNTGSFDKNDGTLSDDSLPLSNEVSQ